MRKGTHKTAAHRPRLQNRIRLPVVVAVVVGVVVVDVDQVVGFQQGVVAEDLLRRAAGRQAIDVRRLESLCPITAEIRVALVVSEDDDDV